MASKDLAMDAAAVAGAIPDGATVAVSGSGGGLLEADHILAAIEQRFLATGHPRDLTVVHALGIGDGKGRGLGRFAHEGMVRRVIGGHWSWSGELQAMAREEKLEAYSFPAGVISTLFREIGAGRPGVITHIGLGTFADPALDGGKCNASARDDLVERVELGGETYLRYRPLKIDVAIIRGSEADARGNVSMAREPADLDAYAVALAAHNCGGRVYAQVKATRPDRILPARLTRVPGILVDGVVEVPDQAQCYCAEYDPSISGETPTDPEAHGGEMALPTGVRRIIAERAAREIGDARSVNFGFGIPGGIPALLAAEGHAEYWGTVEQGIHNGRMLDGEMFGAARDADAILPSVDQFDFYSGGGIDIAFLGMGEMYAQGNVNVSRIGVDVVGPGGFVDITQTARKVVFCGTFEAKGLKVSAGDDGMIAIERHGEIAKLVDRVRHVTFSGEQALKNGQEVLYVTERAVFRLTADGVALVEVPPGIDLERDVLNRMEFTPLMPADAPLARRA